MKIKPWFLWETLMPTYQIIILIKIFQIFLIAFTATHFSRILHHQQAYSKIKNSFSNDYNSTFKSGNLVTTLHDHNAEFLFLGKIKTRKSTIRQYYRYFTEIEKQKYEINEQIQNITWAAELRLDKKNVYLSTDVLLKKQKH